MIIALTSKTLTRGQLYDAASNVLQQRLSQLDGIGQVSIGGATLPAVRVELNPDRHVPLRHRPRGRARGARLREREQPEGRDRGGGAPLSALHQRPGEPCERVPPAGDRLPQRLGGAIVRRRRRRGLGAGPAQRGPSQRPALGARDPVAPARRQHHRYGRSSEGGAAAAAGRAAERCESDHRVGPQRHHPGLAPGHRNGRCCSRSGW